jgi:DNA-binding NarL/FixJ family response regulator
METRMNVSPRILLVDDHPAVRQGLTVVLTSKGYVVAGETDSREDALILLRRAQFDLAILDLTLNGENGLDLLVDLKALGIPALVYSMHESPATMKRAMDCGAHGYVTKREEPAILLEGVESVLRGATYVRPSPTLAQDAGSAADASVVTKGLSERERQILELMGQGEMNTEIAQALHISARTVETYYMRIMEKFGLANVKELRKFAIFQNLTP